VGVEIQAVPFDVHLPAGVAGPDPMDFDVRCFLVPHSAGITLLDTGLPGSAAAIGTALASIGAGWTDVSDILLSHDHPDHVGGLAEALALAPSATVWGNAPLSARVLPDGETVRDLRVVTTPGHTAGHVSFLAGDGTLLVGDLVGSHDGHVERAPAPFTSDAVVAEQSIHKIVSLDARRFLFAHGPEVSEPQQQILALLGR
jgi:glyoxylase-like metal-dependent hydrolase (beta-lactamase superfamily II)